MMVYPLSKWYNRLGQVTGNFTIRDYCAGLSYGSNVKGNLCIGIGMKYIQEEIDTVKAWGVALDLGTYYKTGLDGLDAGLVLQNIGTRMKYKSMRESLVFNIKAGAAYSFLNNKMKAALDFNQEKGNDILVNLGFEYNFINLLKLRVGYNGANEADTGICAGVGFNYKRLSLDYAYTPFGDLGDTQRVSISVKF